jgi:hypothetical protein
MEAVTVHVPDVVPFPAGTVPPDIVIKVPPAGALAVPPAQVVAGAGLPATVKPVPIVARSSVSDVTVTGEVAGLASVMVIKRTVPGVPTSAPA